MAKLSTHGVVRELLITNVEMPIDEVIRKARAKGLKSSDDAIKHAVYNQRTPLRKRAVAGVLVAPAAARATNAAKVTAAESAPVAVAATGTLDVSRVLSNVELVNKIVGICGGATNVRQVVEAVQACGGVNAFLQHLELVANIRTSEKPA